MYVDRPSDHGPGPWWTDVLDLSRRAVKRVRVIESVLVMAISDHLGCCLSHGVGTIISVCLCFSIETVSLFQYYRKYFRVRWSMQVLFNLFKGHGFTKF